MQMFTLPVYLALREFWRNRGRFFLVSLVIALITLLVLFIAALGEGLGNGNREYLSKLDADLIVYQDKADLLINASRINRDRVASVRRVEGVAKAGSIAVANATITQLESGKELKVALLGVDPGEPGEPLVVDGSQLSRANVNEVIIDRNTFLRTGLKAGDDLIIRVTQGTKDQLYSLKMVGVSDGQQYSLQPAIFTPYFNWDQVRPKSEAEVNRTETVVNVIAVKLTDTAKLETMKARLESEVGKIQAVPIPQAIEAVPGYSAQQSTINTQGVFTLLIGLLVIGGFFQIQILQKVPQIGVLKAIGTPNPLVGAAVVTQIILVTTIGVFIGAAGTLLLSLFFPPTIPIVFNSRASLLAIVALLLIGPIGGLVSVLYAARIEPLKALGLST
jgi:putative ABC transport system permease protein